MGEIEAPEEDEFFFDKDHIVFYTDASGEIKCKYSITDGDYFQDLIMAILSGAINDGILNFLIDDLKKHGMDEEAISLAVVKKLLDSEHEKPIVKPSNFR